MKKQLNKYYFNCEIIFLLEAAEIIPGGYLLCAMRLGNIYQLTSTLMLAQLEIAYTKSVLLAFLASRNLVLLRCPKLSYN